MTQRLAETSVDSQPLAGHSFRFASAAPAAEMAAFLVSDLGADVVRVAADAVCDLGDWRNGAAGRVTLSPYGNRGRFAGGPGHHSGVEAVGGAQMGQYTYAPGPAYLVSPYSTVGQALLATAALLASEIQRRPPAMVSGLQGLMAIQSGFYVFGAEREPDRFAHSPRGQTPVYSTHLAADDWMFIGASTTPFMIKVLQTLGLDDVLDDPRVHKDGARALRNSELAREVRERMEPVLRARPRDHWLALFDQLKVPAGPALTMEEALAHPQIRAAGLAEPGEPIGRLTRLTQVTRRSDAAPRTPQTPGPLPLSGLRVVELAGYIAGSYTGRLLMDLGADVVKIEPPDGDPFRQNGYGFVAWNHGKRSLALNLRDPVGRARLLGLVQEADILVTNYRPDALARMQVGEEDLFAVNPGLVYYGASAFGERGPIAHLQGFDPVVQAFAGIMKRQGGDGEPVKPQMAATDYLSAMLGTIGILAARVAQLERGGGYVVKSSLLAATMLLNYSAYEDVRAGRPYLIGGRDFKGPNPLNGLHQARDGWLLTVAPDPAQAAPEVLRYLDGSVAEDTLHEAIAHLGATGVPAVPCIDPWAMQAEPHFTDNNLWMAIEQPDMGNLTLPAPVLGPAASASPAPRLGEHNDLANVWRDSSP